MKENLTMLKIERQMVVDREKKMWERLIPEDNCGWRFTKDRLEIAELKLEHAKRRAYGFEYSNTGKE